MNRLFNIIQILRSARAPIRAKELAEKLEVSIRTVYRDIKELQIQNVPIQEEAGIGYVLNKNFEMKPLMLTPDELEAALLGSLWVSRSGDKALATSANSLIGKINAVVPEHLRKVLLNSALVIPETTISGARSLSAISKVAKDVIDISSLRAAIREKRKTSIVYKVKGKQSKRVIWPFMVAYFEQNRVIAAWCEMRQEFRHFRTDRIMSFNILPETYPSSRQVLKAEWLKGTNNDFKAIDEKDIA